jgi:hypothetical protein
VSGGLSMRFLVILLSLMFPSIVWSQSPSELKNCRSISDNLNRLACFDRIIPLASSAKETDKLNETNFIDFMTDAKKLSGKEIQVSGFGIIIGDNLYLYRAQGEISGIVAELSKLEREGRRSLHANCGTGCNLSVRGVVTSKFGQTGIAANSIEIK